MLPLRFRTDVRVASEGLAFSAQGQARGSRSAHPHRTLVFLCMCARLPVSVVPVVSRPPSHPLL